MLLRPRDNVYSGSSGSTTLPSSNPPHVQHRRRIFNRRLCCCIKPTKVKVENDEILRTNNVNTNDTNTTITTTRRWLLILTITIAVQLFINYVVLQLYFSPRSTITTTVELEPEHLSLSSSSSSSAPPPTQRFLGEYYHLNADVSHHLGVPSQAPPIAKETYETLDFTPMASSTTKTWKKGWTTPTSTVTHSNSESNSRPSLAAVFPPQHINSNAFFAVFRGRFAFEARQYRFVIASSDGVRLWVDNQLIVDAYLHHSTSSLDPVVEHSLVTFDVPSEHIITVEYMKHHTVRGTNGHRKKEQKKRNERETETETTLSSSLSWDAVANTLLSNHLHVHWIPDDAGLKIFMYNLPPRFNVEIVETNVKCRLGHMFGAEMAIHESMKQSVVRTLDPREADLFYVPVYTSCKYLGKPYFGIDPWFGKRMAKKSVQYVKQEFPFWRRRQGQDHVFSMTYDYGACFEYKYSKADAAGVQRVLNNAILLTTISDATVSCFRPSIDVPIPTWINPESRMASALPPLSNSSTKLTKITQMMAEDKDVEERDWLVYFQGSAEWFDHDPEYSNGTFLQSIDNFVVVVVAVAVLSLGSVVVVAETE